MILFAHRNVRNPYQTYSCLEMSLQLQGDLMVVMDETGAPIDEYGPSCILLFGLLFPKYSRETSGQAEHILIKVYDVAWIHGSVIQIAFACVKDLGFRC
jgi:hypothetical protein